MGGRLISVKPRSFILTGLDRTLPAPEDDMKILLGVGAKAGGKISASYASCVHLIDTYVVSVSGQKYAFIYRDPSTSGRQVRAAPAELTGAVNGIPLDRIRWQWRVLAGPGLDLAVFEASGSACRFHASEPGRYLVQAIATHGHQTLLGNAVAEVWVVEIETSLRCPVLREVPAGNGASEPGVSVDDAGSDRRIVFTLDVNLRIESGQLLRKLDAVILRVEGTDENDALYEAGGALILRYQVSPTVGFVYVEYEARGCQSRPGLVFSSPSVFCPRGGWFGLEVTVAPSLKDDETAVTIMVDPHTGAVPTPVTRIVSGFNFLPASSHLGSSPPGTA